MYNGTALISLQLENQTAINGTIPAYAQIIKQNDTIVFHSMKISIVVIANANTWVSDATGMPVPNYDNVSLVSNAFAIYHIYQPTLIIPRGATVNVTSSTWITPTISTLS